MRDLWLTGRFTWKGDSKQSQDIATSNAANEAALSVNTKSCGSLFEALRRESRGAIKTPKEKKGNKRRILLQRGAAESYEDYDHSVGSEKMGLRRKKERRDEQLYLRNLSYTHFRSRHWNLWSVTDPTCWRTLWLIIKHSGATLKIASRKCSGIRLSLGHCLGRCTVWFKISEMMSPGKARRKQWSWGTPALWSW